MKPINEICDTQELITILESSTKDERAELLSLIMCDSAETNRLLVSTDQQSKLFTYCILAGLTDFYPGDAFELPPLFNESKELTNELFNFLESEGILKNLAAHMTIHELANTINLIDNDAILQNLATTLMGSVLNSERDKEQLLALVDDEKKNIVDPPLQLIADDTDTCHHEKDQSDSLAPPSAPHVTLHKRKHSDESDDEKEAEKSTAKRRPKDEDEFDYLALSKAPHVTLHKHKNDDEDVNNILDESDDEEDTEESQQNAGIKKNSNGGQSKINLGI